MSKPTIYEWMIFMVLFTVCVVIIMSVASMVILKIPTNADNKELRSNLVAMLNTMQGAVMAIIAFKIKEVIDNKNKL